MTPDSLLHSEADEMLRRAATELRQLLETGQDCHAETILNAFPYLASDPDRAVELIVLEFQLRRQLGQNPQPRDWYERFPQWREQLWARLEEAAANFDGGKRETTAFATSPYDDADLQAVENGSVDVPVLGRHEILEEIDRGGMGVVYRAYDLVLNRVVALKVIRSGSFASADEVRRFYREARAAAQLRHPNIVTIYGMGLYEKQHCFTMALFPRGSLAQHLTEYRQDARGAVRLVVKVARAVQAAHEQGIIHRDLKPGNILLDEHGEPVVSDFGLAKSVEASATLTLPAQPVGTPAYMAPEQARIETATTASDIWSLGILLYEVLTGRVPFPGRDVDEVKHRIIQEDPISPRHYRPDLPRDLVTILLTCLQKDPPQRYLSAAALGDDLERWLHNEPIQARSEPCWQRLRRQFRRRVGMKGVFLLLVGLVLIGAGAAGVWSFFSFFSSKAQQERSQALVLAFLQRELAEGKRVTLVGPVGPPLWYRYRTEKGRPPLPEKKNWPLELNSVKEVLLLELLPDPQQSSYRFSAEVEQAIPNPSTQPFIEEIGLYFACQELATPAGPEQCFRLFRLKFEYLPIKAERLVTKAELRLSGFLEQDVDELTTRREIATPFNAPPNLVSNVLSPLGDHKGLQWRRIEVQVTPVDVRTFCDGSPMDHYIIAEEQKCLPRKWRAAHPNSFPLPTFPVRGGLGIYIVGGPLNVRNVVVEPLPQP